MDWCDVCKYNPPDYSSHEPDKPCGDCWVYGEGNEPSKFVETENRQSNADRIRSMSDEELAKYIDLHTAEAMWCNAPPDDCPPHETCELCILDWLKAPAKEVDDAKMRNV